MADIPDILVYENPWKGVDTYDGWQFTKSN